MKKDDINKLLKKYEPFMKKTGKQLSQAMKAAEEDISKMYKIAQTHVEIQMKNLQKEKLYYEIGKYAAEKIMKGKLELSDFDKYKKDLEKIDSEGKKIKRKLSGISKADKKKTAVKPARKKAVKKTGTSKNK